MLNLCGKGNKIVKGQKFISFPIVHEMVLELTYLKLLIIGIGGSLEMKGASE